MLNKSLVIIHTESHRSWGGQELRVLYECVWMKKKGHQVMLIAPKHSQIYPKAKAAGLDTLPLSFTNSTALADLVRLRGWLKKYSPDVLNTHGNLDAKVGLVAARGLDIPCVIRSRHHSHPVSPTWYNKIIYRYFSHYIFTSAQCISNQIAHDLDVSPSKVMTVSSGIVPPEHLMEREAALRQVQEAFHLGQDTRFIGSVSMLIDWKGHDYLIDAFSMICNQFPNHHLMIVGDGSQMELLKEQAQRSGLSHRVHFAGFQKDPWPYFRAFDMNVLASTKNDGIPQVLPQSMYAKCPVISTYAGGIPEIVENEKNGLLVAPADSAALAKAMETLLNNPEKTALMVQQAYKTASENHTIDVMTDKILDLYQNAFTPRESFDKETSYKV